MEGVLESAATRSPHAHALIKSVDCSAAKTMPGVVGVMTAEDIRGSNRVGDDQPLLCDKKVHVIGDAVALVVAETKGQARAAAEAVVVEYEPLPLLRRRNRPLPKGASESTKRYPTSVTFILRSREMRSRRSASPMKW